MIEELKQIREKLAEAIEAKDLLYAKMMLNRVDGIVYKLDMENREEIRTPIQDSLYATGRFFTDECTEMAEGILGYLEDAGYKVVKK